MSQCGNWRSKPIGRAPCGSICLLGKQTKMGTPPHHPPQSEIAVPTSDTSAAAPFWAPIRTSATHSHDFSSVGVIITSLSCHNRLSLQCPCCSVCLIIYPVVSLFVYGTSSSPLPSRKWPFLLWCEAWDCSCPFETWPSHLLKM